LRKVPLTVGAREGTRASMFDRAQDRAAGHSRASGRKRMSYLVNQPKGSSLVATGSLNGLQDSSSGLQVRRWSTSTNELNPGKIRR